MNWKVPVENMSARWIMKAVSDWAVRNNADVNIRAVDNIPSGSEEAKGCVLTVRSWDRHLRLDTSDMSLEISTSGGVSRSEKAPGTVRELEVLLGKIFGRKRDVMSR